ncbi:MAG: signal peptidase I [Streptosporangiaceae bacterium]|nr:signal peptidase I [Streptosporangiaceae bacterium]
MPEGAEPDSAEPDGLNPDGLNPDGVNPDSDAPADEDSGGQGQGKKKTRKLVRELVIIVLAAIVLTVLVRTFVVQVYRIPSASMQNTLLPGDRVLVNKLVYRFRGIARGDIVVFAGTGSWGDLEGPPPGPPPSNPVVRFFDDVLSDVGLRSNTTYYIKRVIGLPGDHVACCTNGLVTVNGVALHETGYLYPGAQPSLKTFSTTVPSGKLWVMGDNRGDSLDSRYEGPVPENEVTGRAFLIVWPLSRFGDLPIPQTFKQGALTAAATAASPAATPATATALTGVLLWRRTVRRRRPGRAGGRRRGPRPGR